MAISAALSEVVKQLQSASSSIPRTWDGKDAITEMKDAKFRHWKQMEWMGFYFEFLCEPKFADILTMPGTRYGNTTFDGFKSICWDFKAHAGNTTNHQVIANDIAAVNSTIEEYGHYGLIIANGNVNFDDDAETFKQWHDALKGRPSSYELARINRKANSRRRKTEFVLEEIHFICLDKDAIKQCGRRFIQGRNADGSPRKPKYRILLNRVPDASIVLIA